MSDVTTPEYSARQALWYVQPGEKVQLKHISVHYDPTLDLSYVGIAGLLPHQRTALAYGLAQVDKENVPGERLFSVVGVIKPKSEEDSLPRIVIKGDAVTALHELAYNRRQDVVNVRDSFALGEIKYHTESHLLNHGHFVPMSY